MGLTTWLLKPASVASFLVALLAIAGYGDQPDVVPFGSPPNRPGEFVAGHLRHGDVRQDQLGLFLFNHRQGFRSARCGTHVLPQDRSSVATIKAAGRRSSTIRIRWGGNDLVSSGKSVRFLTNNIACLKNREANGELAALPQSVACCFDSAAVHFHKTLHQGQTDSQPAMGAVQGIVGLNEHLENAGQHVRGDPAAIILHPDRNLVPNSFRGQQNLPARSVYFAALFSRLETTCVSRVGSP